jgi:hypothetical protein
VDEPKLDSDELKVDAKPEGGPECPTCGDRFPSRESLQAHIAEEHKPTG